MKRASGGNPFYVRELLRSLELSGRGVGELDVDDAPSVGVEEIARRVLARRFLVHEGVIRERLTGRGV